MSAGNDPSHLPTRDGDASQSLNVIIETPQGCRTKFKFSPEQGVYTIDKILPAGSVFPFDFGFLPSTEGEDGDPLDILVLIEEPAFPGCLVPTRLIGVIEAEQTCRDGKTIRSDRLIGVALASFRYRDVAALNDLPAVVVERVEHFCISYHEQEGRRFRPLGRFGPDRAENLNRNGAKTK
jgi:inorganic pyrophosphatase